MRVNRCSHGKNHRKPSLKTLRPPSNERLDHSSNKALGSDITESMLENGALSSGRWDWVALLQREEKVRADREQSRPSQFFYHVIYMVFQEGRAFI